MCERCCKEIALIRAERDILRDLLGVLKVKTEDALSLVMSDHGGLCRSPASKEHPKASR